MNSPQPLSEIARQLEIQQANIEHQLEELQEARNFDRVIAVEDEGWRKIFQGQSEENEGPTLTDLHEIAKRLRELATTNPWFIRGSQLRHSYVFGRGMEFTNLKPKAQNAVDDPHTREVIGSVTANETNNLALFTDGNLIVLRNERTNHFINVPITQVCAESTNPDDASDIWYIQRSWGVNKTMWYPTARHKRSLGGRIPRTLKVNGVDQPVSQDTVAYIKRSRRMSGWTWGIPDAAGALVWVMAYTGYLKDNATLVHALSKFAWTITNPSATGLNKAAAEVKNPGIGGTAGMTDGQSLAQVGVPSAQVNMNNGQPLIAAVAAAFGVPVIALISSPGATGGSYGAATTLDTPTLKGFEALQDSWGEFHQYILRDMGSKDALVAFPALDTDPTYRQITSITTAVEMGMLWRDEGRAAVLDILDVPNMHDGLPPEPQAKTGSVVSGQGVEGAVPGGQTQGDTDHELDSDRE